MKLILKTITASLILLGVIKNSYGLTPPEIYKLTSKSVVVVHVPGGLGSGVIISPSLIATNCHVTEDNKNITVEYITSERKQATIVGKNETNDVCIIKINDGPFKGSQPVIGVRRFDTLQVGEQIFALGAPTGLKYSFTGGIISQTRIHNYGELIQFDAALSSGNSGGGLFDQKGYLLGLPSFVKTHSGNGMAAQNLNFAWSVDVFPEPAISALRMNSTTKKESSKTQSTNPISSLDEIKATWISAFEGSDTLKAVEVAKAWTQKSPMNPEAHVSLGRSKDKLKPGSGLNDYNYALKLDNNHHRALYYAALSSKSIGLMSKYHTNKKILSSLNPKLAEQL